MARRQGARRRSREASIRQLPFKNCRNSYRPYDILSEDEVEFLHRRSLDLLEVHGVNFLLDEAREILGRAGATVASGETRVRFDRGLVEETIRTVPSSFTVHARNPAHSIEVGGNAINFILVSSAPNVSDLERGRRPGDFEAFKDLARLGQSLNICHGLQGYPVEPVDLPVPLRHLEAGRALVKLSDKIQPAYGLGRRRLADVHELIRIAYGLTEEEFEGRVNVVTTINCNSPLQYDTHLTQALIENARRGQASIVSPFTLAGAMSPVSLAGTLVQQNAEALAAIVLSQLARPGAPVFYGSFASNVDMKSGAPAFGTPEYAKTVLACGQLARRYGFPYRSSAPSTSNAPDVQGAYETAMSMWPCVLAQVHFVKHALGWQEGGLTSCFEKVVMDAELAQNLAEFLKPLDIREEEVGFEAIQEVGPGGHFFGSSHTLERYESAFYAPMLSDWRNFESWAEDGGKDALARAHAIWKQLLADYEEPRLDPAVEEELDAFVERRIREGGADYGE